MKESNKNIKQELENYWNLSNQKLETHSSNISLLDPA